MFTWLRFPTAVDANPRWYEDASLRQRQEFDAFGPWAYPVTGPEAMPPVFDPWYQANAAARFLIKFPVNIERRIARTGQNLYHTVLAVHDDRLVQLTLQGAEVGERVIKLSEIQAIRHYRCLLAGEFSLHLSDGHIHAIKYNAVSYDLLESVMVHLRRLLSPAGGAGATGGSMQRLGDYYYQVVLDALLRQEPDLRLLHFELPGKFCQSDRGRRRSRLGILMLDNGRELLLHDRGAAWRRGSTASYAGATVSIPHRAIASWSLAPVNPERPLAGQALGFRLDGQEIGRILYDDAGQLGKDLEQRGLKRK